MYIIFYKMTNGKYPLEEGIKIFLTEQQVLKEKTLIQAAFEDFSQQELKAGNICWKEYINTSPEADIISMSEARHNNISMCIDIFSQDKMFSVNLDKE